MASNAKLIASNMKMGGTIMVCGGAAMAAAVRDVLAQEFEVAGLSIAQLKKNKLYREDIY